MEPQPGGSNRTMTSRHEPKHGEPLNDELEIRSEMIEIDDDIFSEI